MNQQQRQISLFPARRSIEIVEQEAIAMLPITDQNELIALVRLVENTVIGCQPTDISACGSGV